MQGVVLNANDFHPFLMIFPHMNLHYKLVPVQYLLVEYEYRLFGERLLATEGPWPL